MEQQLPLSGYKVIELATVVAAPVAARLMADYGAEVIKVETPPYGDPLRQLGDAHGVDDIQPVFVGRKRPVGKVHADARHASFHHALQGLQLGTGGADGTIKFQKITRFRFFLL